MDLQIRLQEPLPGEKAHQKMMPPYRDHLMTSAPKGGFREAAVLALLVQDHIILTKRKAHLKDHAGQISFAGGKREAAESFEQTALREAKEELGISLFSTDILGKLTPLYIPPSRFWVHPFVAYLTELPHFKPQNQEVAQVLHIPLMALQESATIIPWQYQENTIQMPVYQWQEHTIWGATAMMLAELLELFNSS